LFTLHVRTVVNVFSIILFNKIQMFVYIKTLKVESSSLLQKY